jgi:protein-disulfide isomerase
MTELGSAPVPPLRDDDHVRGDAARPLLVFYGDFACPHCAVAHARLRDAPVRVAFRHFALRAKHPRALPLAHAAEAAARQGAFWAMHDALYGDQGRIDDPHLWERVRRLGLDLDRFEADRRSAEVAERVQRDVRDALRAGVTATPTLFAGGECYPGPPSAELVASWFGSDTEASHTHVRRPTGGRPEGTTPI